MADDFVDISQTYLISSPFQLTSRYNMSCLHCLSTLLLVTGKQVWRYQMTTWCVPFVTITIWFLTHDLSPEITADFSGVCAAQSVWCFVKQLVILASVMSVVWMFVSHYIFDIFFVYTMFNKQTFFFHIGGILGLFLDLFSLSCRFVGFPSRGWWT